MQFFVGELVERHNEDIQAALAMAKTEAEQNLQAAGIPLPISLDPGSGVAHELVYGIDRIDYAMTVGDKLIETEGLVTTKARSKLRTFLARAGAPRENSLGDYLPPEAFITIDVAATPDWAGQ